MKLEEKLEILQKENAELKSEVDYLKQMLDLTSLSTQTEFIEKLRELM